MTASPGLPPGNARYRISNRLGSGGMGDVYAALDETLQRRVALKAIQADRRLSAEARERFLREARILSQLDHPNICRAFDYVQGDDADWLVMELVEGRSLAEILRAGPLGARVAGLARQIADVLVVTHAAGIVHRDLKPGNVMVTHTGDVKVLDFGIARAGASPVADGKRELASDRTPASDVHDPDATRLAHGHTLDSSHAITGTASMGGPGSSTVGTLPYMSPEQARGELASSASDIFSFGLVLQEMLTGRRGYETSVPPMVLLEHVRAGKTEPFDDASELAKLVRRMLAPAASQRPTAVDVAARVRWILDAPKRRLRRGLAAAAVLVAVLGTAKYTIDLRRERALAVAAEADANRRRGQAEDLIGFMLGDLRQKLTKAGRLDLLDSVSGKAMDYFSAVPPASLSGEELSQRAQALYQLGDVRQQQGDLKAARAAFDQSLIAADALASRDPGNADWQLRLATAYFYAGDIRRRENDLAGAMKAFGAYREVATKLSARDPGNSTWALEVAFAEGGVAAVQELMGDLRAAKTALENALAVKERLAAADPTKADRQRDLATGHNRLALVLEKLGETESALSHYKADLAIRQAMAEADPANQALKRPLFTALTFLAGAHENAGDLESAREEFQSGFDIMSALAATDRANVNWQRDLGSVQRQIGGVLRATGRAAEARSYYLRARAIQVPIAAKGPTDIAWQRDLAYSELGLGYLDLAAGNTSSARAAAANAVKLLSTLFEKRPENDTAAVLIDAHLLEADAMSRIGQTAGAAATRERALGISQAITGTHSPRLRAHEARALAALGRLDEARMIVTELSRLGYRHWVLTDTKRKIG